MLDLDKQYLPHDHINPGQSVVTSDLQTVVALTAKAIHMFGDRTGIKAEGNPDAIESSSVKVKLESDGGDGIPTCTSSRCDVGTSRGLVRIKKNNSRLSMQLHTWQDRNRLVKRYNY